MTVVGMAIGLALAVSAAQSPVSVHVRHSGDDQVGMRLALDLKERVASSRLYSLADERSAQVILNLISLDAGSRDGVMSAVAVSIISNDECLRYISGEIRTVGTSKVSEVSSGILGFLDSVLSRRRGLQ